MRLQTSLLWLTLLAMGADATSSLRKTSRNRGRKHSNHRVLKPKSHQRNYWNRDYYDDEGSCSARRNPAYTYDDDDDSSGSSSDTSSDNTEVIDFRTFTSEFCEDNHQSTWRFTSSIIGVCRDFSTQDESNVVTSVEVKELPAGCELQVYRASECLDDNSFDMDENTGCLSEDDGLQSFVVTCGNGPGN